MRANPYYLDQRSDLPEQYRAIGWVQGQMYSVVFEIREDGEGEYYHLVTLWKATKQERELYDEHS
ncbi:MAG: BrnT family toxin [Vulcanimicrobiaceae bacterium]